MVYVEITGPAILFVWVVERLLGVKLRQRLQRDAVPLDAVADDGPFTLPDRVAHFLRRDHLHPCRQIAQPVVAPLICNIRLSRRRDRYSGQSLAGLRILNKAHQYAGGDGYSG